jgi:hypothetical protein
VQIRPHGRIAHGRARRRASGDCHRRALFDAGADGRLCVSVDCRRRRRTTHHEIGTAEPDAKENDQNTDANGGRPNGRASRRFTPLEKLLHPLDPLGVPAVLGKLLARVRYSRQLSKRIRSFVRRLLRRHERLGQYRG